MSVIVPRPFAFAIDDLGWNEGSDLSSENPPGPYRAGVKRKFDLKDYQALVTVAKRVGVRIQCLFILSEMDRENILAGFPTTTYQREHWDNSHRISDEQQTIMHYVVEQAAFMEFGLHGTGHEYWAIGKEQKRAEWYNLADKQPWPEQSLREHLQCFANIMAQYGISKENGHSFPESFVPCAYSYYWNPKGDYSLGKLLTEAGVRFANTDFAMIPECNPPKGANAGDFDYGTHVINRINYGNVWYALDCLPTTPLDLQQTDIIESHWPNWLAQDDLLQHEVNERWIAYYHQVQSSDNRYIAKNTAQLHWQWLYNQYTIVSEECNGIVSIDNAAMPAEAYTKLGEGNFVLKVRLEKDEHVSFCELNGKPIAGYFEDAGFGFLYLPPLGKEKYELKYDIGYQLIPVHVYHDGTGNILSFDVSVRSVSIRLRIYGRQNIRVRCPHPTKVAINAGDLTISCYHYESDTGYLIIAAHALDMQGSNGVIIVTWVDR